MARTAFALLILTSALACSRGPSPAAPDPEVAESTVFVGGLKESGGAAEARQAVVNEVHQGGSEVVTLRHFKIKKGSFDEVLRVSREGVWPYFEKIGARVVGMWLVTHPEEAGGGGSPDYDEVYLMTRYASVDHWAATREPTKMGGDGPDWQACFAALQARRALTLETHVIFLDGYRSGNGPYFMPGVQASAPSK